MIYLDDLNYFKFKVKNSIPVVHYCENKEHIIQFYWNNTPLVNYNFREDLNRLYIINFKMKLVDYFCDLFSFDESKMGKDLLEQKKFFLENYIEIVS